MKKIAQIISVFLVTAITSLAWAADDAQKQAELLEKIEKLERQITELQVLKLKKQTLPVKREQCMKAVGIEGYCSCVVEKLPANVDYRQFVHILLTPAAESGYDKMTDEQKKDVDTTLVAWAKCVDYKGPKGAGLLDTILTRETLF